MLDAIRHMHRVLVIEDQLKLRRNLHEFLERAGFDVESVDTGEEGFHRATTKSFDALVLDLTLPKRDGLEILKDLRQRNISTPVIILTARDSIDDRVRGLDEGADDYVAKPFSHAELVARLKALIRRSSASRSHVLQARDLEVDLVSRAVTRSGTEVELSQREFELLEYLLRHKNTNVSRESIAHDVWKEPGGLLTNAVDVCMNGLRKKLHLPNTSPMIDTVRGVGYTIRDHE